MSPTCSPVLALPVAAVTAAAVGAAVVAAARVPVPAVAAVRVPARRRAHRGQARVAERDGGSLSLVPDLGPELGAGLQLEGEELQVSRPRPAPVPGPAPLAAPAHHQHADSAGPPASHRDVLRVREAGQHQGGGALAAAAEGEGARGRGGAVGGARAAAGAGLHGGRQLGLQEADAGVQGVSGLEVGVECTLLVIGTQFFAFHF